MATAKEELAIACVKQNMLEKENTELKHDLKLITEKKDAIVQTDCNNLGVCDMENSAYKKIKVEVIEICD